ncbi:hypothetical protein THAOC_27277 [Thalassiosira oceanica]|uniref:Uncharacterized protein n=1 Tax=Thalassiosira oceanica TaxID=159749 RepID=K0RWT5_THAOC|nr:hypothetical protein THAOC_27277 [Thalassiosira oceanica]|eukprot:EJK53311.1 hypothetical protein THAOC_27277 [Thalassiosira oceanica]
MEVEVAIHVHGVSPLPMGIERAGRHERKGLNAWRGSKAPSTHQIWGQSGCWNAQISAEQWGAAMEVEVAIRVHGVSPLPMGIGRGDRHKRTGLHAWKGSKAPETHQIWGQSGCWNAQISAEQWGAAMEVEVAIHVHGVSPLPMVSIVLLVVDRQRVRTNPDRSWQSSFNSSFGVKVCPSFLPTKACNRTVALSRTTPRGPNVRPNKWKGTTAAVLSKKNVFLFLKIFFLLRSTAATVSSEKKILFRFLEHVLGLEHGSERHLILLACS